MGISIGIAIPKEIPIKNANLKRSFLLEKENFKNPLSFTDCRKVNPKIHWEFVAQSLVDFDEGSVKLSDKEKLKRQLLGNTYHGPS